ncbi:hypothetical protein EES41_36755 (plasmid) [Streptomyces sp. ADI95-16]|nr:hypothetical protein EES41_36755 [Streptomyces sp. ADI95-16]
MTSYLIVIALIIWALGAIQWKNAGCDLKESIGAVITDGFPESYEECPTTEDP